jgi:selenide, water dikinase
LALAGRGLLTGGDKTNREYVGEDVDIAEAVDRNLVKLFFDPQTAGGMLISISSDQAEPLLSRLRENYSRATVIGKVMKSDGTSIVVG